MYRQIIIVAAFIIYAIVAFNSSGYHHEDEHYQIIGLSELKAGNTSDFTWEFRKQIRSTLQPTLCMGIFWVLRSINITNPFDLAFALRLITVLLSIGVLSYFTKSCQILLHQKYWIPFLLGSFFIWFVPYINVRYSSEAWSGLFCLLSIGILLNATSKKNNKVYYLLIGITLGLAFLLRFQTIFISFGLLLWCYFKGGIRNTGFYFIITSFILVLALGFILDSWFYNSWTLTSFNYLKLNVLDDIASYYGRTPWYDIIFYLLTQPTHLIGFILCISFLNLLLSKSGNIFVWSILPFLIIHSIIPHKEVRFLFPLANFAAIIVFLTLQQRELILLRSPRVLFFSIIGIILIVNFSALAVICFKSARNGETEISRYIYDNYNDQNVNVISTFEANPYDPHMAFKHHFYKSPKTTISTISSLWENDFSNSLRASDVNFLVITEDQYTGMLTERRLEELGMIKVKSALSPFEKTILNSYNNLLGETFPISRELILYRYAN